MLKMVNQISIIKRVFEHIYPDVDCYLQFDDSLRKILFWGGWGYTIFPDDKTQIPIIKISTRLPFKYLIEIVGHELAHVVAGEEAGHGDSWKFVFNLLSVEYVKLLVSEQILKEK